MRCCVPGAARSPRYWRRCPTLVKTSTSSAGRSTGGRDEPVYLVDTDVISDARKRTRANPGVRRFFRDTASQGIPLFLSAVTIGELRQGVEAVRHRGDLA